MLPSSTVARCVRNALGLLLLFAPGYVAAQGADARAAERPETKQVASSSVGGMQGELVLPIDYLELKGTLPTVPARRLDGLPAALIDAGDLDRDGAPDIVVVFDEVVGDDTRRVVRAFSSDGKTLWNKAAPLLFLEDEKTVSITPTGLSPIPDVTGDECPDICVAGTNAGAFAILDGATGRVMSAFAERDPLYHALGNVYPATGMAEDNLIFATLPNRERADETDRLGFSLLSSETFKQLASYQHPFKRIKSESRFVGGGFVTNDDNERTPFLLACGKSKPSRRSKAKTTIAAIYGRWFNRVRYAPIEFDMLRTGVRVTLFDTVAPQSRFPTMGVLLPGTETEPATVLVVNPDEDRPRWRWTESELNPTGPKYANIDQAGDESKRLPNGLTRLCRLIHIPARATFPEGGLALLTEGRMPELMMIDLKTGRQMFWSSLGVSADHDLTIGGAIKSKFQGNECLIVSICDAKVATVKLVRVSMP